MIIFVSLIYVLYETFSKIPSNSLDKQVLCATSNLRKGIKNMEDHDLIENSLPALAISNLGRVSAQQCFFYFLQKQGHTDPKLQAHYSELADCTIWAYTRVVDAITIERGTSSKRVVQETSVDSWQEYFMKNIKSSFEATTYSQENQEKFIAQFADYAEKCLAQAKEMRGNSAYASKCWAIVKESLINQRAGYVLQTLQEHPLFTKRLAERMPGYDRPQIANTPPHPEAVAEAQVCTHPVGRQNPRE